MTAAVRCRPAVAGDTPRLAQIFYDARRRTFTWLPADSLSLDDFARETAGERVVVATVGDAVWGFVAVWVPDRFIHHLFVDPSRQRMGVGTALLDGLRDWLPLPWRLKCVAANAPALAFYAARGWRPVDRGADFAGEYVVLELT